MARAPRQSEILFQVSNQITLGEAEEEIIERLKKVIETIIEHEQNARLLLLAAQADCACLIRSGVAMASSRTPTRSVQRKL